MEHVTASSGRGLACLKGRAAARGWLSWKPIGPFWGLGPWKGTPGRAQRFALLAYVAPMLFIIVLLLVGQSPARRPWPVRVARGRARSATIRNVTAVPFYTVFFGALNSCARGVPCFVYNAGSYRPVAKQCYPVPVSDIASSPDFIMIAM